MNIGVGSPEIYNLSNGREDKITCCCINHQGTILAIVSTSLLGTTGHMYGTFRIYMLQRL